MADDQGRKSFWTFWTTLPGILSGLAAVITAVGGLITAIYVFTGPEPPPPTPVAPTLTPALPTATVPSATGLPTGVLPDGEIPLAPGTTQASLGPGQRDVHPLEIPPQGRAGITVEASGGVCFQVAVLDSARARIARSADECSVSEYFAILTDDSSGGAYYLEVTGGTSLSAGSYTIDFQPGKQDDAGSGGDAGRSVESAVVLDGSRIAQGVVGSRDPEDYYRFRADSSTVLEVQYETWDELEVLLLSLGNSGEVTGQEPVSRGQAVDFGQRAGENYALRITGQAGEALYTIILGMK